MRLVVLGCTALLLTLGCADDRGSGSDAGPAGGFDAGPPTDGSAPPSTDGSGPPIGRGIGEPCSTDADCTDPPDAMCFTTIENPLTGAVVADFPNGFCSLGCEESSDCGTGEDVSCVSSSSSGGMSSMTLMYCTTACDSAADCRQSEGYRCDEIFGFGFCAPP